MTAMWICDCCGSVFDEPRRCGGNKPLFSEELITAPESIVCPVCADGEVFPAGRCGACGKACRSEASLCPECEERFSALAAKAHRLSDELFFDLVAQYSAGNASAREYMESMF